MREGAWIGLAVGIATGLWMWAEYALGLHTVRADVGRLTGFFSIVFPLAGMLLALRRLRTRRGELTWRAGATLVLVVSIAATVAMAVMSAVYIHALNPQWSVQAGTTPSAFVLNGAVAALVGGIVVGLIVLAILRARTRTVATP